MIRLGGDNDFHEGWLWCHVGLPRRPGASTGWLAGYRLCEETPSGVVLPGGRVISRHDLFHVMVGLGQIVIDPAGERAHRAEFDCPPAYEA